MNSICDFSIRELRDGLKRRDLSAEEIARAFLDRIEEIDPEVSAFLTINRRNVLDTARKIDRELASGDRKVGRMTGIPIALKDNIITRGGAEGVTSAVSVSGQYKLIGNHISGFDEKDAAAIELKTKRPAGGGPMVFSGNTIENCSQAVKTTDPRLWEEAKKSGNLFIGCWTAE